MNLEVLKQQIGKRIKMIRISSGLKQKELAAELSVAPSLLSMYEQGVREPSISFLCSYLNHFDLSLSQFFSLVEDDKQDISPEVATLIGSFRKMILELERNILQSG